VRKQNTSFARLGQWKMLSRSRRKVPYKCTGSGKIVVPEHAIIMGRLAAK
jgi:hypothetical protein